MFYMPKSIRVLIQHMDLGGNNIRSDGAVALLCYEFLYYLDSIGLGWQ